MREEAGNEYQGLSLGGSFDMRIFATQYTSESDSFDNYSIKTSEGSNSEVQKVNHTKTIDGKTYSEWYAAYTYTVTYMKEKTVLCV